MLFIRRLSVIFCRCTCFNHSVLYDFKIIAIVVPFVDGLLWPSSRMWFLNIQPIVPWSGLMQRIHCFCCIPVGALESQRYGVPWFLLGSCFLPHLAHSDIKFLKGVLHTTGGYMVYTATTFKYAFDYKPSDVYWYS